MQVHFKTRKLEKQYEYHQEAVKAYGMQVGRKYILRINIIKSATDINELRSLPGLRCHPLKGDRTGQWAINLTGFFRLIFTVKGKKLEIACIEEVSKHYDK
jgi:toxin HigB-1